MPIRRNLIACGLLAVLGCVSIPTYRKSLGMEMLPNPDPRGGLIDPNILGPTSTFLSGRGYATAPIDGMGPILTMERRTDSMADRISLLESRHEGDPSGWITIEAAATTYVVRAGKYTAIRPTPQVRADAYSLIALLHVRDSTKANQQP